MSSLYISTSVRHRPTTSHTLAPLLLVLLAHALQDPEVVEEVEGGGDEGAGGGGGEGDFGRDGEAAALLRVDVDEGGDEAGEGVEEADSVYGTC